MASSGPAGDNGTLRTRGPFPLPLVGREAELASLGSWLDDVAAARGGATLLAGVGGVGKTRLVGAILDAVRMRRKLAWVLAKTGDLDGAMREVRRAHDAFLRMRAEVELNLTRDVIRELGLRPPSRSTVAGLGALTGREVDVARLAASRKSNKEIASTLGISPRTVSTHLSSIFLKLEVASRGELADVARRQGLLVS